MVVVRSGRSGGDKCVGSGGVRETETRGRDKSRSCPEVKTFSSVSHARASYGLVCVLSSDILTRVWLWFLIENVLRKSQSPSAAIDRSCLVSARGNSEEEVAMDGSFKK